jgi:hypothetical protein
LNLFWVNGKEKNIIFDLGVGKDHFLLKNKKLDTWYSPLEKMIG